MMHDTKWTFSNNINPLNTKAEFHEEETNGNVKYKSINSYLSLVLLLSLIILRKTLLKML
jgi:hypothetical protein